ncbi:ATP-dependent zinc protease [Candidatus Woesearchaeota archaeon]|nr:ATP-dependent zinc protease [Candidatus Woesearchaeota archaeon]
MKQEQTTKKKASGKSSKTIVGIDEKIILIGEDREKEVWARIDTGATHSSIDLKLASEIGLGPIKKTKVIKSSHGKSVRPVVVCKLKIKDKIIESAFTVYNRSHMTYPVLIGQNTLKNNGFMVDPDISNRKIKKKNKD